MCARATAIGKLFISNAIFDSGGASHVWAGPNSADPGFIRARSPGRGRASLPAPYRQSKSRLRHAARRLARRLPVGCTPCGFDRVPPAGPIRRQAHMAWSERDCSSSNRITDRRGTRAFLTGNFFSPPRVRGVARRNFGLFRKRNIAGIFMSWPACRGRKGIDGNFPALSAPRRGGAICPGTLGRAL
jgi:hypothetical protein